MSELPATRLCPVCDRSIPGQIAETCSKACGAAMRMRRRRTGQAPLNPALAAMGRAGGLRSGQVRRAKAAARYRTPEQHPGERRSD
jgi:predicted nucleic acid-binding Zn ribbon protein